MDDQLPAPCTACKERKRGRKVQSIEFFFEFLYRGLRSYKFTCFLASCQHTNQNAHSRCMIHFAKYQISPNTLSITNTKYTRSQLPNSTSPDSLSRIEHTLSPSFTKNQPNANADKRHKLQLLSCQLTAEVLSPDLGWPCGCGYVGFMSDDAHMRICGCVSADKIGQKWVKIGQK